MSEIIAYKDQNNEYFDFEIENSKPIRAKSDDALNIMRHDMAHVLAEAVISIFPTAKPTIGPFIKNGFYYDFDMDSALSDDDINKIEEKIKEILNEGREFNKKVVSKDEALNLFKENKYKLELINNLDNAAEITLYEQKNFTDLCKGPHHKSTKEYEAQVKICLLYTSSPRDVEESRMPSSA